jgi:ABC-2 type transport system permease protein
VRAAAIARALPTLFKVGFAEGLAYRAELLIWILSTTMPFIMLVLWSAVAEDGPVGRFGQREFVAYFLATFVVRQLAGSWVAWEMNYEVRHGTLSMRLLRPLPPVVPYVAESLAVLPMRAVACLPVVVLALALGGPRSLPHEPAVWAAWLVAMAGSWSITFLAGFSIGCLAFFVESSVKVFAVWLALFYVFSGYLVPVELFPAWLSGVADWLPFRYQLGLPVELLTGAHDRSAAVGLLARQWLYVAFFGALAAALWRTGLRRFAAFGG